MKKFMVLLVVLFATVTVFGQASKNAQDQQACEYARRNNSAEIWQDYLNQFPQGICSFEAKSEIKKRGNDDQNRIGGLQWSSRSSKKMNWKSAVNYCKNLSEGGFNDWRLPNIDELRTTVKNCPKTETGGQCKVSEKNGCLAGKCWWPEGSCFCDYRKNNGGYYSKLGDDNKVWLWSSSFTAGNSTSRWNILFSQGLVDGNDMDSNYYVRCVR